MCVEVNLEVEDSCPVKMKKIVEVEKSDALCQRN